MSDPYQVFVSFRNTDDSGRPVRDAELALQVYERLTSRGLSVFCSSVSLKASGVSAYKPAIDRALDSAQALVAIGTSGENLESRWVRYEWDSFANDVLSGIKPDGRIYVYVDGVDPRALPRTLRQAQVIQHGDGGMDELCGFVTRGLSEARAHGAPAARAITSGEARPGHGTGRRESLSASAIRFLRWHREATASRAVAEVLARAADRLQKGPRPQQSAVIAHLRDREAELRRRLETAQGAQRKPDLDLLASALGKLAILNEAGADYGAALEYRQQQEQALREVQSLHRLAECRDHQAELLVELGRADEAIAAWQGGDGAVGVLARLDEEERRARESKDRYAQGALLGKKSVMLALCAGDLAAALLAAEKAFALASNHGYQDLRDALRELIEAYRAASGPGFGRRPPRIRS